MKDKSHIITGPAVAATVMHMDPFYVNDNPIKLGVSYIVATFIVSFGACLPDLPIFICEHLLKKPGEKPFSREQTSTFERTLEFILKSASHSWLLFTGLFIFLMVQGSTLYVSMGYLFLLGVLSHLVMDLFTHTHPAFARTDQDNFWPIRYVLPKGPKFSHWLGKTFGFAAIDYRHGTDDAANDYALRYANMDTKQGEYAYQAVMASIWLLMSFSLIMKTQII
ncbi:metal-dependent hydrolase [Patescibacteria group bacterium]|nr:metal-dependent hydrolase [Patescibacteria group bacterium]